MDIIDQDKQEFEEQCPNSLYFPMIFPAQKRIIAIGDLHGDYALTINIFKELELIDSNNNWIGKDVYVVQMGDQLDGTRNKHEHINKNNIENTAEDIKVFNFMTKLAYQARQSNSNSNVISLYGNHELMNVLGDFRYVSGHDKFDTRQLKFKPGGSYAKKLACDRLPIIIIGSYLFVHGGLTAESNIHSIQDLIELNSLLRKWLLGLVNEDNIVNIINDEHSLFWNRLLGKLPPNIDSINDGKCHEYLDHLKLLKVNNIIIGHTPQMDGINSTCDDHIWRIDTGMSKAFGDRDAAQVLEILNDNIINIIEI